MKTEKLCAEVTIIVMALVVVPMSAQFASAEDAHNSFFILPESVIGVIALVASSLAVLGGFMFLRSQRISNLPI